MKLRGDFGPIIFRYHYSDTQISYQLIASDFVVDHPSKIGRVKWHILTKRGCLRLQTLPH